MTDEVLWEPQPRQAAFIGCPADDVGFGGARGGGKSEAIIGDFIEHEFSYGQHAKAMAVRRSRTELVDLIARGRQRLVPFGYRWHEQDKYFEGPKGGRWRFAYLENDTDADGYQGHEYTRIYGEEIGTFPNDRPINKLFATLRSAQGVPCQMKNTLNPGGAGHQWVKSRYKLSGIVKEVIRQNFEFENPFTGKKIPKTRVFIPSKLQDNKYLGDDYVANIMQSGGKELVRAWLEGDWDVVEGAFFDCWSHAAHVIPPFAVPSDWLRYRSFDWGFAAPFAGYWLAVAGSDYIPANGRGVRINDEGLADARESSLSIIPRGALVVYREWYGGDKPNVGARLTAEQAGPIIVDKEANEKLAFGVIDPSAFNNMGGPPIAEVLNKALLAAKHMPFRPADNRKEAKVGAIGGWDVMRARLVGQQGRPMLYFFSTCVNAIRTIPALQHDPDKAEDIAPNMEDHAADAIRYACMARPWIARVKEPEPDKSELKFEVVDGKLMANMSVKEIVMQKMKRKRANGH